MPLLPRTSNCSDVLLELPPVWISFEFGFEFILIQCVESVTYVGFVVATAELTRDISNNRISEFNDCE